MRTDTPQESNSTISLQENQTPNKYRQLTHSPYQEQHSAYKQEEEARRERIEEFSHSQERKS